MLTVGGQVFLELARRKVLAGRIAEAFPPVVGGMTPKSRRPETVLGIIEEVGGPSAINEVSSSLIGLSEDARFVGCRLTVNSLGRLAGVFAGRFRGYKAGEISLAPPLYKGVSYNPSGQDWQEWLVLLDFFAIMRRFAERFSSGQPFPMAILDASLYWVVNQLGEEGLLAVNADLEEAAASIISDLVSKAECQEPNPEVYRRALSRNCYMRAMAEEFPASLAPRVFSVLDVWREPGFVKFLGAALRNFCEYSGGRWRVVRAVSYDRYMRYSPWGTPLVVAEHAFLAAEYGFRMSLAPIPEAVWNKAVDYMSRATETPLYATLMYQRPSTGEVPYRGFPFFSDGAEVVADKFRNAPALLPAVSGLVKPFLPATEVARLGEAVSTGKGGVAAELIVGFTGRVDRRARQLAESGIPPLPLSNMGWLMQFPSRTC